MRLFGLAPTACAILIAGNATAQTAPAPTPMPAGPPQMNGMSGDAAERYLDRQSNYRRMDGDVAGSSRSLRQYRAKTKDIVPGSEVHDSTGVVVGTIAKVDNGFAVVAGPLGSVEVDVGSIAKNKNGLLINMPKAKIDGMMSRTKPAG